jgi:hypothetical protein
MINYELLEDDAFGAGGRTVEWRTMTAKVIGGTRQFQQVHIVSADLSAHEIPIDPLGSGLVTSNTMFILNTDYKVDIRIGDQSNVPISNTQLMVFTGTVSAIWITTGSIATTVRTVLVGGSGASVNVSPPLV